jgi:glycosyltransferase involved in cell wall biosynthesis
MSQNPKISVIMSVYNGQKYLSEAIESILNQTFTDFEFIIINDASIDNSLEIIRSYDDSRIHIITNETNIGLTKSLNKAIKGARGKYNARQDADDISLPIRFAEQLSYLEQHPKVALLGTSVYHIDEQGKVLGQVIVPVKPGDALLKENQFNHGSTIFNKNVVVELGGYNELLKYSQDYELWLRISRHHEVSNLSRPLYKLRFHQDTISIKHVDESVLYHILALKLACGNVDNRALETIAGQGIKSLVQYLDRKEKAYFHSLMANILVRCRDTKRARNEYKAAFKLNRFDIKNALNILLSYLGADVLYKAHKTYLSLKNLSTYLKNLASKSR